MSVRPGLRADHGLIALSAALACSGAVVSGTPGLDHKGLGLKKLKIYIYEVHAFSSARVEISVYSWSESRSEIFRTINGWDKQT